MAQTKVPSWIFEVDEVDSWRMKRPLLKELTLFPEALMPRFLFVIMLPFFPETKNDPKLQLLLMNKEDIDIWGPLILLLYLSNFAPPLFLLILGLVLSGVLSLISKTFPSTPFSYTQAFSIISYSSFPIAVIMTIVGILSLMVSSYLMLSGMVWCGRVVSAIWSASSSLAMIHLTSSSTSSSSSSLSQNQELVNLQSKEEDEERGGGGGEEKGDEESFPTTSSSSPRSKKKKKKLSMLLYPLLLLGYLYITSLCQLPKFMAKSPSTL